MRFHIDIQNDNHFPLTPSRLEKAVLTVLNAHELEAETSMTVVISTDEAVHALNKSHRGVDAPTDVLSFPADTLPQEIAEDVGEYLGDLIIAYPYSREQARREAFDLDDMLDLLVIHGTLHLLGYDHDTPENRAEMWESQATALDALGINQAIVPSLEGSDHA